jgi:ABC-type branched-subunit amino acid transport system permease subunit
MDSFSTSAILAGLAGFLFWILVIFRPDPS